MRKFLMLGMVAIFVLFTVLLTGCSGEADDENNDEVETDTEIIEEIESAPVEEEALEEEQDNEVEAENEEEAKKSVPQSSFGHQVNMDIKGEIEKNLDEKWWVMD